MKGKGAILRSKVRWHEEGERNTKYSCDIKMVSELKVGENSRNLKSRKRFLGVAKPFHQQQQQLRKITIFESDKHNCTERRRKEFLQRVAK